MCYAHVFVQVCMPVHPQNAKENIRWPVPSLSTLFYGDRLSLDQELSWQSASPAMLLPLLPIAKGLQTHACSCLALYIIWAQVPLLAQLVLLLTGPSLQPRSWNFLHVVVVSCELLKSLGTWNISEFGLAKRNLYHHLSFDEFTKAFIIVLFVWFLLLLFSPSLFHIGSLFGLGWSWVSCVI